MAQRVLITAGAAGIVKEIARTFVVNGATVCAREIDAKALDAAAKDIPGLKTIPCDVSKRQDIERMTVDVVGTFHVTRLSIPYLKKSAAGSIIIRSSLRGGFGYPNRSAYCTAKMGLIGFAKTLSRETRCSFGFFPNWLGQTQRHVMKIEGDMLHLSTAAPIKSAVQETNSYVSWKRAEPVN